MKTASCLSMHTPYAQCGSPLISHFFCRQLFFPLLWCCLIVIKGHIVYLYVTKKRKILHIQLEIDSGHIGSRSEHSVTEI